MLYQDQKKFDKAIKHLNESKRIMESSNLEKDAYLGRVYINLGNLYAKSGLYEDAKKNLQNGIKLMD